ncbi:MAG: putative peptidoglycan glycosyltransferase FtsW [Pseudomonadota bacterium]
MRAISRIDESLFARWWWSVDRSLLAILAPIIIVGLVALMAAGPAAADRLRIANDFHFPMRQALFLGPALAVMIALSFLSPLQARRFGVLLFLGAILLMVAALFLAPEVNGARRWFYFGSFALQPSEFAKPGFVIAAAWMMAEGARDKTFPGGAVALGLYLLLAALLMAQPDFGQWALLTGVWALMFFVAGWSWTWIASLAGAGMFALGGAYMASDHVARRIDGFLRPGTGETYQVDRALETIANGGAIGRGDAAAVKGFLPDAHTDFIFAATAEDFGFAFGLVVISLFAAFVIRALIIAARQRSAFAQCAIAGLAALVGFQAIINIGVSLRALPAKGMTLPFISYGGSSLLATGVAVGLLLALTRRHMGARRRKDVMP